jgi:hypothetical protein
MVLQRTLFFNNTNSGTGKCSEYDMYKPVHIKRKNHPTFYEKDKKFAHTHKISVSDPEPHWIRTQSGLLDPDLHSECGSGSRRCKISKNGGKKGSQKTENSS